MKRFILAMLLTLAMPALALAHAFLDHADPKVGSTVSSVPDTVHLWFTDEIVPSDSAIQVFDSGGNEVDKKDSRLDDKDKKLLIISLAPLPSGTYKVSWHVVCACCKERTQGDFKFSVK
jgi:methionine-rich copper-binding protein CopC